MPFVGSEVGQDVGDACREGVVEVGRLWGAAGASQLQEPGDRQIDVQREAVTPCADHASDGFADQGLAVAGEAAGEVVVAVLGGEVTDQDLPSPAAGAGGAGSRDGEGRPDRATP